MSKRDELAAVLGEHRVNYRHDNVGPKPVTAENLRYTSCEGCDWLGGWHDEAGWERHAADAVLAWLGEQFDEGLREGVMLGIAGTQKPCRKAIRDNGGCVTDFGPCLCASETDAALAVVRERLGLSDAAQDAQDGARTASEVGSGSECHSDAARPGESRRESENER